MRGRSTIPIPHFFTQNWGDSFWAQALPLSLSGKASHQKSPFYTPSQAQSGPHFPLSGSHLYRTVCRRDLAASLIGLREQHIVCHLAAHQASQPGPFRLQLGLAFRVVGILQERDKLLALGEVHHVLQHMGAWYEDLEEHAAIIAWT